MSLCTTSSKVKRSIQMSGTLIFSRPWISAGINNYPVECHKPSCGWAKRRVAVYFKPGFNANCILVVPPPARQTAQQQLFMICWVSNCYHFNLVKHIQVLCFAVTFASKKLAISFWFNNWFLILFFNVDDCVTNCRLGNLSMLLAMLYLYL